MTFREFLFRRQEVVGYVTKGWLRHTLDLPNQHDVAEALFDAQPKAHNDKYAETHEDVETDISKLQNFFEHKHEQDVQNGTYKRLVQDKQERV